jgi:hypothetical protein
MKTSRVCGLMGAVLALFGLTLLSVSPGLAGPENSAAVDYRLLEIGKIGPKAAKVEIWTNKPKTEGFEPGEPISVHAKAAVKVYLTAIYVSSQGDAYVLFPNRESTDGALEPGQERILFNDKSAVKLTVGEKVKTARIAFYVSSKPVDWAPLAIGEKKPCIIVPRSSEKDMTILTKKLETIAQDETFNRVIMALAAGSGIRLMGLPSGSSSGKTEGVAGVAGQSGQPLDEIEGDGTGKKP